MKHILRYVLAVFLVGVALPTAASLFILGGVAQSTGFPFTIGSTAINALATVPSLLGLTSLGTNGISTASTTDPIIDYACAGVDATTTGTISSGSPTLTVASAAGWLQGMGIAVANAGAGGTTELITTISTIAGTTFTLAANAAATATGQVVHHDDTACLTNAVISGKNVHLRLGTYNVTSVITTNRSVIIKGEGSAFNWNANFPSSQVATLQTVIQNRGTTNSVFKIANSYVQIKDIAVIQATGITPTAGYAFTMGHPSAYIEGILLERVAAFNTYGGLDVGNGGDGHVLEAHVLRSFFVTNLSPTFGVVIINNPSPAGDLHLVGTTIYCTNAVCMKIARADVSSYEDNKMNGCGTSCLVIDGSAGSVVSQFFTHDSFEAGANSGPLVQISGTNVTGISFVGGEVGVDNSKGGFLISGTGSTVINGVIFNAVAGTPIANTSSGIKCTVANIPVNGTSAITNAC